MDGSQRKHQKHLINYQIILIQYVNKYHVPIKRPLNAFLYQSVEVEGEQDKSNGALVLQNKLLGKHISITEMNESPLVQLQ